MKLRRTLRYHGLQRPRVRQTWNKYNLFNLTRLQGDPKTRRLIERTFFQQKWYAKALTRGYHGEHIKERQWERMFSRRLLSVVDMDPKYMARHDGSEHAAGRGSGRDLTRTEQRERDKRVPRNTPYMHMTFAPMERRLDIAIFRSLFASSARQARQFVVHGAVKVNGKKMVYPGYLLNPGDMFQVDIERVMLATGKNKEKALSSSKKSSRSEEEQEEEPAESEVAENDEAAEPAEELDEAVALEKEKAELKALRDRVKIILDDPSKRLSAKQKQALRGLSKDVRAAMSRAGKGDASSSKPSSIVDDLSTLLSTLDISSTGKSAADKPAEGETAAKSGAAGTLSHEERERLDQLLAREAENPYDPSKPYMTPWRPRPYMAPFAFIPRYLEVNQKICAAVYLRHPVARQSQSEVPTPFRYEISQLAFNWYLRRR